MGIKGLLPLLHSVQEDKHIREFEGQTAGIDGYVWLHRAAYSFATELALVEQEEKDLGDEPQEEPGVCQQHFVSSSSTSEQENEQKNPATRTADESEKCASSTSAVSVSPTVLSPRKMRIYEKMAQFVVKNYCQKLMAHGVQCHVVFDGGFLPMKEKEEKQRDAGRRKNLEKGLELYFQKNDKEGAFKAFASAYDIVPEMASVCCKLFQVYGIAYTVAPYEADAQLSWLMENKRVDFLITEDSDLLAFHPRNRVLYKLDFSSMTGKFVALQSAEDFEKRIKDSALEKLFVVPDQHAKLSTSTRGGQQHPGSLSENSETETRFEFYRRLFLAACILLGCDYGDTTIPKAGPKKVCDLVAKAGYDPEKIAKCARFDGLDVGKDFVKNFAKAWLCFHHQTIFATGPDPAQENRLTALREVADCSTSKAGAFAHYAKGSRKIFENLAHPEEMLVSFCGRRYDAETAREVAKGKMHPVTFRKIHLVSTAAASGSGSGAVLSSAGGSTRNDTSSASSSFTASRPALPARIIATKVRKNNNSARGGGKKKDETNPDPNQISILSFFKPVALTNRTEKQQKELSLQKKRTAGGTSASVGNGKKDEVGPSTKRRKLDVGTTGEEENQSSSEPYVPRRFRGRQEEELRTYLAEEGGGTDAGLHAFEAQFANQNDEVDDQAHHHRGEDLRDTVGPPKEQVELSNRSGPSRNRQPQQEKNIPGRTSSVVAGKNVAREQVDEIGSPGEQGQPEPGDESQHLPDGGAPVVDTDILVGTDGKENDQKTVNTAQREQGSLSSCARGQDHVEAGDGGSKNDIHETTSEVVGAAVPSPESAGYLRDDDDPGEKEEEQLPIASEPNRNILKKPGAKKKQGGPRPGGISSDGNNQIDDFFSAFAFNSQQSSQGTPLRGGNKVLKASNKLRQGKMNMVSNRSTSNFQQGMTSATTGDVDGGQKAKQKAHIKQDKTTGKEQQVEAGHDSPPPPSAAKKKMGKAGGRGGATTASKNKMMNAAGSSPAAAASATELGKPACSRPSPPGTGQASSAPGVGLSASSLQFLESLGWSKPKPSQ
ncbi:unnamed protein product [Amoebophrya sp. A120]|nr:unnamed protein product [Amoebophrya sp. A120]|eukprot:GSA120T00005899001.1